MREPARQHDGVDAAECRVTVPQQLRGPAELLERRDDVEFAVGSREDDDADAGGHARSNAVIVRA